jgi:hypothetical protein
MKGINRLIKEIEKDIRKYGGAFRPYNATDLAEHEKQCQKLLGQPFTKIHEFLDQYNQPDEHPFTSLEHRRHFHHFEGIAMVAERFGSWAIIPAAIHILEDCLGYIPHQADYETNVVDQYGRPLDSAKINIKWFEQFQIKRT